MGASDPLVHGALDHHELHQLGLNPQTLLDFSSNINPFGPPSGLREALASLDPAPYPDRSCYTLRTMLASVHACPPIAILPGNGANEFIYLIARALLTRDDPVLIIGPTYGEYHAACRLVGTQPHELRATPDPFTPNIDQICTTITRLRPRLTWICSPNNPTGVDFAPATLTQLATICMEQDGWLVVDRSYADLRLTAVPNNLAQPELHPGILWLGSLTKSYGLAGLRVGYLLAEPARIAQIAAYQPTWSVNSAAQLAGVVALADHEFLPRSVPQIWAASDQLRTGFGELGLPVWRAALPFMLVRSGNGAVTRQALLQRGYVVRDCTSFGLPDWVRVAPRHAAENARLLAAWKELL
jgi:threonine-phosphate decarboxylase